MRPPRIFYLMSDNDAPAGGEKSSYQHVDILNEAGYDVFAVHGENYERHTWFSNQTRVCDKEQFRTLCDADRDFVVVPEVMGVESVSLPGKIVIFNKGLWLGFQCFGKAKHTVYPYTDPRVRGIFTVSDHNQRHLQFAFPRAEVFRMYHHIDCNLFSLQLFHHKKRRIACVYKAIDSLAVLYHSLTARSGAGLNDLNNYEWTILRGHSEEGMAKILQEALIVISLNTHEGLPRVVLEAMACGCIVVACNAGPLKEILPPGYRYDQDDLVTMARSIEAIAAAFPSGLAHWAKTITLGRGIAEEYTRERQRLHLIAAWEHILSRA